MAAMNGCEYEGMWVFDDPAVGLSREPFVAGIDTMIDRLVASIPGAERGFRLVFSARPFPGHTLKLEWRREESGGNCCIEDALRDYIRHVLIPRGLLKREKFLATFAGHTALNREEAIVVEKLADLIAQLHELDPQTDRVSRDRLFEEISRLGITVARV